MKLDTQVKNSPKIFYGWWVVVSAAVSSAIHAGILLYGFGPFFDSLVEEFKASRAAVSLAISISRLEGGVLGPIDGFLVDKFGPRRISLFGRVLMGSGLIVLSRISSINQFYLVYAAMVTLGAGLGFFTATYTAVGNWFVKKRGIAFGITEAGIGAGGLLVPLVSLLVIHYGWRQAWLIIGITVLVVAPPLALLLRHKPEQYGYVPDGITATEIETAETNRPAQKASEDTDFTTGEALRTRAFWFLALVFTLRLMVTSAIPIHIMPYLLDVGFDRGIAATALGSIGIVSGVARLGFGWLSDIIDKKYIIVGLLGLLTGALSFLGYVKNLWQLVLFILCYAPAYGGLAVLMQAIRGQYFGRRNFGTIMGFMNSITMIGTVAGPYFAGYTWDATGSYRRAFLVFAVAAAIAMMLALLTKPPLKKKSS
ncbi:MAG: MFS transporter [Chloroflexota bacterium]